MKYLAGCTLLILAGCASTPPAEKPIGMPNPASVYCKDQGGTLEIRSGPNGQTGYCHLPDGRVNEEWAFFRASQKASGS